MTEDDLTLREWLEVIIAAEIQADARIRTAEAAIASCEEMDRNGRLPDGQRRAEAFGHVRDLEDARRLRALVSRALDSEIDCAFVTGGRRCVVKGRELALGSA